jgi:hypothetical protein
LVEKEMIDRPSTPTVLLRRQRGFPRDEQPATWALPGS